MAAAHPIKAAGGEAWFIEVETEYAERRKNLKALSRSTFQLDGDDFVPAAAASSYRAAASALQFAMTQRSGRSSPGIKGTDGGEPAEASVDDPTEELFSTMKSQWVEVECLLRAQLREREDAVQEARERVTAALAFDNALGKLASDRGILKGTIFQALLASVEGSDSASAKSVGLDDMSASEWVSQAARADALRKLVRIKVQDDNDLKAANGALSSCGDFFANLSIYCSRRGLRETAVLEKLDKM